MIRLDNITKTFEVAHEENIKVYDNFSFEVERGDFVSIIGGNGSGKSTLLNIISGVYSIDSGKIYINNQDVTKLKEYKRAKMIGKVSQNISNNTASNLTVLENIALYENKNKRYSLTFYKNKNKINDYKDMLATLGLGLENKLNVKTGNLSGGQRQALALLMATMTPIDILLLDEHTAALDPKASELVMRLTDRIVREKNITTLMVTHNMPMAIEYGNRLCMFDKGKIILDERGESKQNLTKEHIISVFNSTLF